MNDSFNRQARRDAKYDTGKIPLTNSEREMQERINRERYEQIMQKQQNSTPEQNYPYVRPANINNTYSQDSGENNYAKRRRSDISPNPPKKKKKKRGCGCTSVFVSLLLVIVLIFGCTFGYIYMLCGKTNYVESDRGLSFLSDAKSDPFIYNVLLIGTDKSDDGGTSRSDTMLLVSVDRKNKTLKFTSFMRDLWVEIPGHDDSKLNAAFAYGGAELLMKTIENNFKIKINNYVLVDFDMFKSLIDGLGGVTVDITEAEAKFINRTTHAHVEPGTNTLNGDYALIYCRIRKLDSDFNRTQRQRKVMAAIFEQIKEQNIFENISAVNNVIPLITTDIAPLKMTLKAFSAISLLTYGNDQLRIPVDGGYTSKTIRGQAALVPDSDKNTEAVQNFICN